MHTFKSGILAYSRQTRVNEHHERPKLILNAIIIISMLNAIIPRVIIYLIKIGLFNDYLLIHK